MYTITGHVTFNVMFNVMYTITGHVTFNVK